MSGTYAARDATAGVRAKQDAMTIAALLALAPRAFGGLHLVAPHGPGTTAIIELITTIAAATVHRVPPSIDQTQLCGGLDLAATLHRGHAVQSPGLLAAARDGLIVVSGAERLPRSIAVHLAAALDDDAPVRGPRALIAHDEGRDDERVPSCLAARLGLYLDLTAVPRLALSAADLEHLGAQLARARVRLAAGIDVSGKVEVIAGLALALDIPSLRTQCHALAAARGAAALRDAAAVNDDDIDTALNLVLLPRARRLPADLNADTPPPPPPPADPQQNDEAAPQAADPQALADQILAATVANLPADVLDALCSSARARSGDTASRNIATARRARAGRPLGAERGSPSAGARLDVIATLRAAAPWQSVRGRPQPRAADPFPALRFRRSDFRIKRFSRPEGHTRLFVVDASGSAALHRLAEAKGAVELLLAESYARRDQVALIAFRGREAQLLLPPTRALARAKRALAELPGGGGTPLASALLLAHKTAAEIRARGNGVTVVLLTDGRGNIDRGGRPGRAAAAADTVAAARALRAAGVASLVIDTSARPDPAARELAEAAAARYLALPYADGRALATAIGAVTDRRP